MKIYIAMSFEREILGCGYSLEELKNRVHLKFMFYNPGKKVWIKKIRKNCFKVLINYDTHEETIEVFSIEKSEIL